MTCGFFGLDPEQIGAVLQAGDTVHHHASLTAALLELEQTRGQPLDRNQTAVLLDHDIVGPDLVGVLDLPAVEEAVVLLAQIARLVGHGDLLGQAGAQRIGTGNNDTVIHAQLQECIAHRVDLGQETCVRHGDLAILMAALLDVRDLVFDLDGTGAGLDHLLGQEIGRLFVAEAGINIGDDRDDVGLEVVDLIPGLSGGDFITGLPGGFQITEIMVQFPRIGLLEEGIEFLDEHRHGGLFVHGLIRQRDRIPI